MAGWINGDLLTPANLNALSALRQGVYNILEYDADPTGATDSTDAIQAAIDACGLAGGGIVYTPPGTFLFNSQLAHARDNVIFIGAGDKSIWQSGVTSGTAIYINDNSGGGSVINGFHMRDMYIDGSGTEDLLLRVDYALDGSMYNVRIQGSGGTGVYFGRMQNFNVFDCNIRSNKGWGAIVSTDGQGNAGQTGRFLYNTIKGNGSAGGGTGGLKLISGAEHMVIGNQIESHDFDANCRGIQIFTDRTAARNNIFESNSVPMELGSLNGSYGESTDRILNACDILENISRNGVANEVRYVNVGAGMRIENNDWENTTIIVGTTGDKYLLINDLTDATLSTSVRAGKIVTETNALGGSNAGGMQLTWTDQDTTPTVRGYTAFRTANTMATSITTFDGGHTGKIFFVRVGDALTTFVNGTPLITGTGANITPANGDVLVFCGLSGTASTNTPVWRLIGYMSATGVVAGSSGTITVASGSANNGTTTGWHEVAPGRWVPYITDPTP